MGRKLKVYPDDVLEKINGHKRITVDQLAEMFECCPQTVRSRLRTLRDDGEFILHDSEGLFSIEDINDVENRDEVLKYANWIISTLSGIAKCGKVVKPLVLKSKAFIRNNLTKEERKALRDYTAKIHNIIEYIEIESELEDE